MNRTKSCLWLLLAVCRWPTPGWSQQQQVTVYLRDSATVPASVAGPAQNGAAEIFGRIGVKIHWRQGVPPASLKRAIGVELVAYTPQITLPGALACTVLYDYPTIQVFYDRIQGAEAPGRVLAHVLAHEITHVLQGTARHSDTGIMKASWSRSDFDRMRFTTLTFTEEDVGLIRGAFATRSQQIEQHQPPLTAAAGQ
jgi:hypothetical protein